MAAKPSWKERLGYRFDNFMARGTLALIGGLGALSLLVIAAAGAAVSFGGGAVAPEGAANPGFGEAVWMSLMRAIDSGAVGGDSGWGFRLVMFLVTLGGIFILSTLIGVLTAGVEARIERLRQGRSRVLETGHTVILGWSPQIFTVVPEIVEANSNRPGAAIAVLADRDKVEMETELRARLGKQCRTRIICRSGSPMDMADLETVSPHDARSIVILPPEEGDADSAVIKTALALTNSPHRRAGAYNIVTQLKDARNLEVLRLIGAKDTLSALVSGDLIARVTAQTSRLSGLSTIYTELLDFGGDEIYFKDEPRLAGSSYGDALGRFADSALIGLRFADGTTRLNPPMETPIKTGDALIAISADDDTVRLSEGPPPAVREEAIRSGAVRRTSPPESCLILGWNAKAPTILRELDGYVPAGSSVTVVADAAYREAAEACAGLERQKLEFRAGDATDRRLLDSLKPADFDHVIVLADGALDVQAADARTLVTLLHLRDIAEKDATPFSIISEMLDLRNRELAEAARVDDFIVSDHLISLMTAQLAENPGLLPVFDELFSPEGAELYLKPAEDYVEPGKPVDFYTVVEAARRRGETAVGYRLAGQVRSAEAGYGVRTNPPKAEAVAFAAGDKVIVLAEE